MWGSVDYRRKAERKPEHRPNLTSIYCEARRALTDTKREWAATRRMAELAMMKLEKQGTAPGHNENLGKLRAMLAAREALENKEANSNCPVRR
jgi:hypothetical protein